MLGSDDEVLSSSEGLEDVEIEETVHARVVQGKTKQKLPFDSAPRSDSNNMKMEFMRSVRNYKAHITFTETGEVRTLAANFEEVAAELLLHPQFTRPLSLSKEPGKRLQQVYAKFQKVVTMLENQGVANLPPYALAVQKCVKEAAAAKEAYKTKRADKRKLEEEKLDAEKNVLAHTVTKEANAARKKRGAAPPVVGYVHDPVVEHFIKGGSKKPTSTECHVTERLKENGFNTINDLFSVGGAGLDEAEKQKIVTATGFKLNKPASRFLLFFDEVMAEKSPVQALASKTNVNIGSATDVVEFLSAYYTVEAEK